jgi:hypothetical protein
MKGKLHCAPFALLLLAVSTAKGQLSPNVSILRQD